MGMQPLLAEIEGLFMKSRPIEPAESCLDGPAHVMAAAKKPQNIEDTYHLG